MLCKVIVAKEMGGLSCLIIIDIFLINGTKINCYFNMVCWQKNAFVVSEVTLFVTAVVTITMDGTGFVGLFVFVFGSFLGFPLCS